MNRIFIDFQLTENCIKEIDYKDLGFIKNQIIESKGLKIKDKKLKEYWPVDSSFHYIKIDSTSDNSISVPLISKDRSQVLLYILKRGGLLDGQGGTYVYKRVNNKWIRNRLIDFWIA